MTLQYAWFQNIVINQDWKKVQTPNEILLIASSPKNQPSLIAFSNSRGKSPVIRFKKNSVVVIRGGQIFYDTDNIIPERRIKKKKRTKKRSK